MIKIGILGSTGRVGSLLIDDLANDSEARASVVHVNGKLVKNLAADTIVTNDMKVLFDSSDVIIDFSAPAATELLLTEVVENGAKKPLVIATTGFNKHQQNLLLEASKIVPILYATNMSLGVAVLNKLSST
jgi:4-hydroxy-tetrahydrodipicolinate reductase